MSLLDRLRGVLPGSSPPETQEEDIKVAPFGIIQQGDRREIVEFDQHGQPMTGSITPEEAERLKRNNRGIGNLNIDLDDYIEEGRDITVDKEENEWLYEFWKMRQDDSVRDALRYILSILHTNKYYIEPASEDEQDLDIAAFIADSLGLDGKRAGKYPWERLLKSYEQSLIYRRSAGELVFNLGEDGNVLLDKIIPIHPFNIVEIKRDSRGGPRRLEVRGTIANEDRDSKEAEIAFWKLMMFVNDDEGDMRGESILEAAWLPWKVKRAMLQLMNAGFERFLLGIPVLKLPKGVTQGSQDWKDARATLTKFAMKPRTGMLVPDGYEFEIHVVNSQMPDALPYLQHMDEAIYKSMGMTFSTMGRGENASGSYTVGAELSESAVRNVARITQQFLSYINTYLVPKLVMVNWPDAKNYPTLKVSRANPADTASLLNAYGQMVSASMGEGGFDEAQYKAIMNAAPSIIREVLGIDADRRRELVESRRRSVR